VSGRMMVGEGGGGGGWGKRGVGGGGEREVAMPESIYPAVSFLHSPNKSPVCTSPLPHTCHRPRPPQSPPFNQLNDVSPAVRIMKPLNTQLSHLSCELLFIRQSILDAQFSNTLSLRFSLNVRPDTHTQNNNNNVIYKSHKITSKD